LGTSDFLMKPAHPKAKFPALGTVPKVMGTALLFARDLTELLLARSCSIPEACPFGRIGFSLIATALVDIVGTFADNGLGTGMQAAA